MMSEMSSKEYVDTLDVDGLARWYCLIQGVRVIFDKMEDLGEDVEKGLKNKRFFNRVERCLNAYIEEKLPTVKSDIVLNHQKLVDTFDIIDEDE